MDGEIIYEILARWGYLHPIHPILAHIPIGLMIASLIYFIAGKYSNRVDFITSAKLNSQLSLIFLLLVIVTGVFDWNRFYGGAWLTEVKMKLVLAVALLLITGLIIGSRPANARKSDRLLILYLFGTVNVGALGYYGGQLVYEGRAPTAPENLQSGRRVFYSRCSGCHANGGNIILPGHPLRSSQELDSLEQFSKFVRNPRLPDGDQGPMPNFSERELDSQDLKDVFEYIRFSFREHRH